MYILNEFGQEMYPLINYSGSSETYVAYTICTLYQCY